MGEILGWVFSIIVTLGFFYIVFWNIERLVYYIKCYKVGVCSNRKCHFKIYCEKYEEICTKEEFDEIAQLLEDYRKANGLKRLQDPKEQERSKI